MYAILNARVQASRRDKGRSVAERMGCAGRLIASGRRDVRQLDSDAEVSNGLLVVLEPGRVLTTRRVRRHGTRAEVGLCGSETGTTERADDIRVAIHRLAR